MLLLLLLIGAVVGYDGSVNYWQAFAPGKLLQRLDALTLDEATTLPTTVAAAQPKLDVADDYDDGEVLEEAADIVTDDHDDDGDGVADAIEQDADDDSTEALSGEDYERNYEQFVRQYFDRVGQDDDDADHDSDDDNAEEHETQLDDSIETQAEASNVQRQHKPKDKRHDKCRRVRRHDQLCTICREPRNNEVSETCSYSHEAQPEQYAYGSGSQYRRYRDKEPVEKRHTTIVQPADSSSSTTTNNNNNSSLCVRRLHGKSICYECKDSAGKRMNRCYDAASSKKRSSSKPHGGQSEQEQRIYKRTISYSYAQDSSNHDEQLTTTSPPSSIVTTPAAGRRVTKLLRRRTAILPRRVVQ